MVPMALVLLYAVGLLVYSAVGRRDLRFLVAQSVGGCLLVGCGTAILGIEAGVPRAALLALAFIFVALLPRVLFPRHPVEAEALAKENQKQTLTVGIVDFTWVLVMAVVLAVVVFAAGSPPFSRTQPAPGMGRDYYICSYDGAEFLLGKILDSILVVGTVLAACMAIIWSGAIWRRSDRQGRAQYVRTTMAAMQMVVAYVIIVLSALIWLGAPIYGRMNDLVEMLK